MKKILITGAAGFIGSNLSDYLTKKGFCVHGVDIKDYEYGKLNVSEFYKLDLRDTNETDSLLKYNKYDTVFHLAADMGGAGYTFTKENDHQIMCNSTYIDLNVFKSCAKHNVKTLLYTSTACVYPVSNQTDSETPVCYENTVYPAEPDSNYGWGKLYSERLISAIAEKSNMNAIVVRLHNIYGPLGEFSTLKAKAPAALCYKVANANSDTIEVWGPGTQTRSFLYIKDCLNALYKLALRGKEAGPVNVGSERIISINDLAKIIIDISGKSLKIKNVKGPTGVNGRVSNNDLLKSYIKWDETVSLEKGLALTYNWINSQINNK